jgi:cell division protein FtsQ
LFALIGRGAQRNGSAAADGASQRDALVLPRPLRRVARFLRSPRIDEWSVPRHTGSLAAGAFLLATGVYGMILGGHTEYVFRTSTAVAGFSVRDIAIEGHKETSEIDVLQALGLAGDMSVMAMSVAEARQAILDLPWVSDVAVRKVYPHGIAVTIEERDAFAIWQNGNDLFLIEKDGDVIAPMNERKFVDLPFFVGLGADKDAARLQNVMGKYPGIADRVRAYVRVADRRWDLYLNNGVVVQLPEDDLEQAVAYLASMDGDHDLLSRDVAAVDLRLADRMAVRLSPDALEKRQAMVEERAKKIKALEKQV